MFELWRLVRTGNQQLFSRKLCILWQTDNSPYGRLLMLRQSAKVFKYSFKKLLI
ncbi:hypothetical protein IQ264_05595 [Phormidium sp. LEGE 05292]|uniref:hypothetical protein n=1 Tax=[Phormidium] sp. LEGE 05292 TaxID=767427 RepID=UPI0018816CC1|nr:hypothetical protein [Phormidium sp. LEGE 05292]MBE9224938.1 hypothetical protein [Phormidium sp. LEGE 05292]